MEFEPAVPEGLVFFSFFGKIPKKIIRDERTTGLCDPGAIKNLIQIVFIINFFK